MKRHADYTRFIPPVAIYLLSLIGPALVIGLPLMLGWSKGFVFSRLYVLGTLGQGLMELPAVIMFTRVHRENIGRDRARDQAISIGVGLACAAVLAAIKLMLLGRLVFMGGVPAFTQSLALTPPWNMISATLAVLAYGPGEAILVVYLVIAFDAAMGIQQRLFSWGVVITAFLWGLPHIWNVFFFGWGALANALLMVAVGLMIGLLLKGTRSSWGPIVFWTLINGTSA